MITKDIYKYFIIRMLTLGSNSGSSTTWQDINYVITKLETMKLDISQEIFWDKWLEIWVERGNYYKNLGREDNASKIDKVFFLKREIACYHWAGFMFFNNNSKKSQLRLEVRRLFNLVLIELELPIVKGVFKYDVLDITYYIITPDRSNVDSNFPTIIINNGLDSMTEIEIFTIAEYFVKYGFAVILFDGPGQGINVGVSKLEYKSELIVEQLLIHLKNITFINMNKMIFFGISFGGYGALRIAKYLGDKFIASINLSGGDVVQQFDKLPRRLKADFCSVFMEEPSKMQIILNDLILDNISSKTTNLLSIHGSKDDIFPIEHVIELKEKFENHTLWIYDDEVHVCLNMYDHYMPRIIAWLNALI